MMIGRLFAPGLDLCQHRLWPFGCNLELAEKDLARVTVDREPIPFKKRHAADRGTMGCGIDHQSGTAYHTGLAHLTRDERGMRGASAHRGESTSSGSETRDIARVDIRADQHHGIA